MTSKACCTIPPVVQDTDSYKEKGTYETISNLKTYITGSRDAKTGIFVVYDIFGLPFPQTIQGSDILSTGTNSLVVIPDIFDGKPMPISGFPPDTPEKQKALGDFFAGPANPPATVEKIRNTIFPGIQAKFPGVEKWAILGYCWGGKVTTMLSTAGTPFKATVQCHPAMLDPEDAGKLVVPHLCIATVDEDAGDVKKFEANLPESLKEKSKVVKWDDTFHGFMAARANLKDQGNYEFYQKGYKLVVHFLNESL